MFRPLLLWHGITDLLFLYRSHLLCRHQKLILLKCKCPRKSPSLPNLLRVSLLVGYRRSRKKNEADATLSCRRSLESFHYDLVVVVVGFRIIREEN
jgi:hypothetical protein